MDTASIFDALDESLEFKKEGLFCSIFAKSTAKDHFIIEKNGCKFRYSMGNLPLLYNGRLNIKAEKLKDVRELAAKYVPAENLWFYEQFEETKYDNSVLSDYEY